MVMRAGLLCILLFSSPTWACERDAPTARLPGYSEDQMWERAHTMWNDWTIIGRYQLTESLFSDATNVYLAKIRFSEQVQNGFATKTTILPLTAIKGSLPKSPPTLMGYMRDSCDGANGDGDGAYAKVGELIVVFDNVAKRPSRPNGIDSVLFKDVRKIEILDAVEAWFRTQPGYEPFD